MAKEPVAVQPVESTPEKELTFVFTLSQANIILSSLDEIPHKLSRKIIDEMQKQAYPQMQEQTTE
jgi:hypothetical protein